MDISAWKGGGGKGTGKAGLIARNWTHLLFSKETARKTHADIGLYNNEEEEEEEAEVEEE